jgi:hypothetical protein
MNFELGQHPVTPPTVDVAKNDLNYTSYGELVDRRDLLSDTQQQLLSFLNYRKLQKGLPEQVAFTGSIFTMIEHGSAFNLVHCGRVGKSRRGVCREPFFCQNCARRKAREFLRKTVTRFDRGSWFWATLSFSDPVVFGSSAMDEAERCWRVTGETLDAGAPLWAGCVYREEVAISDFLPLSIRPHAHMLIYSETPEFDAAALQEGFNEAAGAHHLRTMVSFDCKPVEDLDAYIRAVHYLFKPIDVSTSYRKTWAALGGSFSGQELHALRRQVNSELTDAIYGVQSLRPMNSDADAECDVATLTAGDEGQRRLIYTGVFSSRSKNSFFLTKKQMALAKDKIDRILRHGAKGAKRVRRKRERRPENSSAVRETRACSR